MAISLTSNLVNLSFSRQLILEIEGSNFRPKDFKISDMLMSSQLTNYLVLDGPYYKIDMWKNQCRLFSLEINSRGSTLVNEKEYFLKVLVAGGGELVVKPQLLVLSTILCTVYLYVFKIKGPVIFFFFFIILQEY